MQINGGTATFTHYFNGDSITNNLIQNLGAGTYIDSIVDANGCFSIDIITLIYNDCSATLDTIGTCAPLTLSAQTTNILSSSYSYTYNLYFEGTLIEVFQSNLDSIGFITMVSDSGQYLLEVINDSTGCISSDSMVINVTNMSINATLFPVLSQGACDGQISMTVVGGNFPYTITWDTSGTVFNGPTQPFGTSNLFLLSLIQTKLLQ